MKRLFFICGLVFLASAAQGQTPVGLAPVPRPVFTQNGAPLVNGCLFSFAAGTSTPLATFADSSGTVSNPNPTILDANGTPSVSGNEVGIYLSSANYKFQLKAFGGSNCASGASVWTADNINAASFLNLPNSWIATQSFNAGAGNQDIIAGNIDTIRLVDGVKFSTPQAAIADCPATDCWVLVKPGTYSAPTNISRSHLHLQGYNQGVPAATITAATDLVWGTPPADNKVIFTSAINIVLTGVWDTTIEGITFDFGGNNAGLVLQNGVFENHFGTPSSKLVIQNCGTGTGLLLSAGSGANQSVVGNYFDLSIFNVGKGMVFTGLSTDVASNNIFHDVHINGISTRGIEFVQNADTNRFWWVFISGLANTAQAVAFNTGSPAVDNDSDANIFFNLLTDPQNPNSYTGTLVQVNKSVGNEIHNWNIGVGITSGGGIELATANAPTFSYDVSFDVNTSVNNNLHAIGGPLLLGGTLNNFANTAAMGQILKKGSGAGNYSSTSTTFAAVDGTNLTSTVTIPVGWKLHIEASGTATNVTAPAGTAVALYDGACNVGTALQAEHVSDTAAAQWIPFNLSWVITGDGAAHPINLCYLTLNAADAVNIENTGAFIPTMTFRLMPSN